MTRENQSQSLLKYLVIVGSILQVLLTTADKWNANQGSAGYIPFPMWGEVKGLRLGSVIPANISITMLRMISKIDVVLFTDIAQDNFTLESVRLYNYNNQGYIAPIASNWNSGLLAVTAPSIPLTAHKPTSPVNSPLIYEGPAIIRDTDNRGVACIDEIYTFEANAGIDSTITNNTCLVIGGTFTGDSQITYYRCTPFQYGSNCIKLEQWPDGRC